MSVFNLWNRAVFFEPDDGAGGGGEAGGETLLSGKEQDGKKQDGTPPPGASEVKGWVGDDGAFLDGWADRLPEDLKDAVPTAGRYKSVPEMVKALHHANQALGKKGVIIPTEKSSPEEVAAFRAALGVPESPDKYVLKPEKLPEGVSWSDEMAKPYAELAHKHNISQAAMAELVALNVQQQQAAMSAAGAMVEQKISEGFEVLKSTWKADTDKNLAMAGRVAKTVGLDPTSPGLTDPNVVIALERLGRMLSEDRLIRSDVAATMMPGKARANEIMTNAADPLYADYHGQNGPDRQQQAAKMVADLLSNG